jgi:hypothetical protein
MTIFVRIIVVTLLSIGVASVALAQTPRGPKVTGPVQMPVDPGVPIGCLLNPNCGPKLFVHPDGKIVTPQAPVDPIKGLPCLLDSKNCGNLLSVSERVALFQRSVTPDDVAAKGAMPGDYIPFPSHSALAPQSIGPSQPPASPSQCTASIVGANESARSAQQPPNDSDKRRATLDVVVSAYTMALRACQPLKR